MASDSYSQLEKKHYSLTEEHDLVIRVIEHKEVLREEGHRTIKESVPHKVHEVKVKRGILLDAAVYFKKLIDGGFKEKQRSVVDLHEDYAEAAQGTILWVRILHAKDPREMNDTFKSTDLRGLWEMLAAAHKYGIDPTRSAAKAWFDGWYMANNVKPNWKRSGAHFDFQDYQMLLFPLHTFDHAAGFAKATHYLVYHATGHITEKRPMLFKYDHLRLDQLIIQQLNAARGRLKTILHRGLYDPIATLLEKSHCVCKEKTLYEYEKALYDTDAWPLEQAYLKNSVTSLFGKLKGFSCNIGSKSCQRGVCGYKFDMVVQGAIEKTQDYFDGLCLDCMNGSKPKFGDADEDYWKHAERRHNWDSGCRIKHGQPTWYFSFMGRREKMIKWLNRSRTYDDSD